jgi:hypothetical protein
MGPERATETLKKKIYSKVADNLGYAPDFVRKVVAYFLKNK